MKSKNSKRKCGTLSKLLIKNYTMFTLSILIVFGVIYSVLNYYVYITLSLPQIDLFIEKAKNISDNQFMNIKTNKYLGNQGEFILLNENGKTISQLDYTQGKLISGKLYYENGNILSKIEGKKMTIFYSSGKKLFTMDKSDVAVYHENGKEVFSNSDEGVKINGEAAEKSLLDMFSKDKLLKTALYLLTSSTVQAEYKNGKPSIQLQGTTAVMYYESGKILLELSPSLDGTVNSKIYYENGQLMQVEDRNKSGRSVKVYDKAGNLIADTTYTKEHEIRQIF